MNKNNNGGRGVIITKSKAKAHQPNYANGAAIRERYIRQGLIKPLTDSRYELERLDDELDFCSRINLICNRVLFPRFAA